MVKKFLFFHGAILSKLIHHSKESLDIKTYPTESNSSYIINDSVGLYIKYSTKRMTPWRFSFKREHQDEIKEMIDNLKRVFIVFICNDNGIAVLSFDEFKIILDHDHDEVEWIALSRKPKEKYSVKGSDGKLHFKVGNKDFPRKIFDALDLLIKGDRHL